jgi:predicted GIY-YIG superfamily endonuclease
MLDYIGRIEMAKLGTLTLEGKSGKKYDFDIYPIDSDWNEVAVLYVVTKRYKSQGGGYKHTLIYIGETDNLKERFEGHHKAKCFSRHKANCVCTHADSSERSRTSKESDLLAKKSTKCND